MNIDSEIEEIYKASSNTYKKEDNSVETNKWKPVKKKNSKTVNKNILRGILISLCVLGIAGITKIATSTRENDEKDPKKVINTSVEIPNQIETKETFEETETTAPNRPKPFEELAKSYFFQGHDQEYLNIVTDGSHEAWLALPDNIRRWIRDPEQMAIGQIQREEDEKKSEEARAMLETVEYIEKKDVKVIANESTHYNGDITIEILEDEITMDDDILIIEEDDVEPLKIYTEDITIILPDDEDER